MVYIFAFEWYTKQFLKKKSVDELIRIYEKNMFTTHVSCHFCGH